MRTKDLISENVKKIAEDFPMCITEIEDKDGNLKKAVDFERLKEVLTGDIRDTEEPYVFTWAGKSKALENAFTSIDINLRPVVEDSVNFYDTNNIYIEGDNLEVLKILQRSYFEKVKMIYIDPPYNTGHDFIYKDEDNQSKEEYKEKIGTYDDEENILFENKETNGRFHSNWCSMIYSRLLLARNLLRPDGVIFISIDDNEVASLRKICDEVFGEDNFVNLITLHLKNNAGASGGGEDKRLKKNCEYLLFYAKNYNKISTFNGPYDYIKLINLLKTYQTENKSWKYNSVLIDKGDKKFIASTVDGDGNTINIYERINFKSSSISQFAKENNISTDDVFNKFYQQIYRTTMPQSSIRPRVMKKMNELGLYKDVISIEYIPKTGKNKGKIYEQFYSGEKYNLFAWLSDVIEIKNDIPYKKEQQGTLWDFVGETKNLSHEGDISFPNGKKPVKLLKQMLSISTPPRVA